MCLHAAPAYTVPVLQDGFAGFSSGLNRLARLCVCAWALWQHGDSYGLSTSVAHRGKAEGLLGSLGALHTCHLEAVGLVWTDLCKTVVSSFKQFWLSFAVLACIQACWRIV